MIYGTPSINSNFWNIVYLFYYINTINVMESIILFGNSENLNDLKKLTISIPINLVY